MRAVLVPALLVAASAAAAAPAERLYAGEHWAALRFASACVAAARPLPPASSREPQARAGFTFDPARRQVGAFHVRLSRPARPGASVILTVGDQPFLLAGRGDWAWSRGGGQGLAIVAAVRAARSMRVETRDAAGRRLRDHYLLAGAPTAIDAAAAGCARLATAGKI